MRGTPLAVGLVVTAVTVLQFGAGWAVTLFDELGPGGAAFLRLAIAAAILVALWRPRLREHARGDLRMCDDRIDGIDGAHRNAGRQQHRFPFLVAAREKCVLQCGDDVVVVERGGGHREHVEDPPAVGRQQR